MNSLIKAGYFRTQNLYLQSLRRTCFILIIELNEHINCQYQPVNIYQSVSHKIKNSPSFPFQFPNLSSSNHFTYEPDEISKSINISQCLITTFLAHLKYDHMPEQLC